ncbi:MAG TPA: glycosyltransferase family 1 protein [Gemmatimonadales bacterium]|nr:glycosyltransferase family 1 protein [Gemmatimonadales bacterium]
MTHLRPLRVAIDATQVTYASGGVAQAVLGLIHALGRLHDGDEEGVIVVNSEQDTSWLAPFVGANQRFVTRPATGSGLLRNALRPLGSAVRHMRHWVNGGAARWPEVPMSNGFYENLGCDVIHFPHQQFVLCALPTIYNPHDLQHRHYPQFFSPSELAWRETIYPAGSHLAQTVVVASRWIKEDVIQQYGIAPQKIQIIPWGAPTQALAEPSADDLETVRAKYQLEQPFAIFPAVTWPHKNHLRLFEALAYLRDQRGLTVRVIATGSRYEPFWPEIERQLDLLALQSQVKFLGFVPDRDLRALYRLAQYLLMPTLFESDSFPIYEAWLEGTPVACSAVCSLPEQAREAAVFFDPYSIESMANAIASLTTDRSLRAELQERGRRRLQDFDWQRTAKAYRAVYRRAANRDMSDEDRWLLSWDWMQEPRRAEERSTE